MRLGLGLGIGMTAGGATADAPILETIVDTRLGSGTFTPPYSGVGSATGVGSGGAGLTLFGGGGGGARSKKNITFASGVGLAYVSGVGGVTAGSDGTDSTLDSTLCVAKAGKGRTNGGAGGLASECVGDVKHSGGDGTAGAATAAGGGVGGSDTDAAGQIGGDPDGATNINSATPNDFGAGGHSTNAASRPGANGCWIFEYPQLADETFPWQVGSTQGRDATDVTTRDITLPACDDGDVIALFVASDGSGDVTMAGDWRRVSHTASGALLRGATFVTDKSGATTLTITTVSEQVTWICTSVKGSSGADDAEVTDLASVGGTTNPTPPTHTPSQGSGNYLYFVFAFWDGNAAMNLTAWPANHESRRFQQEKLASGTRTALCFVRATGTSHSPGAWGSSVEDNVVGVMSIKAA